ncbi:hypothetical protein OHC33_003968 [Knufia fluminis]|uniref:Uncharacterized protein n=1 Tax=Knufia fluminis TaxID=191047 RepID=A0AAN8FBP0_9EURO|nr:hypothetical protein OHC33_003968 [Knufia fluminis]
MNTASIILSNDIAPSARLISLQWHCRRKPAKEEEVIAKYAAVTAETKNADEVYIREGMHNTTKGPLGKSITDPDGWHYTAEYRDRKTKNWTTWHHYFVKQNDGSFVVKDKLAKGPNPAFYPNTKGKSNTKTSEVGKGMKLWAWKGGKQQYAKVVQL